MVGRKANYPEARKQAASLLEKLNSFDPAGVPSCMAHGRRSGVGTSAQRRSCNRRICLLIASALSVSSLPAAAFFGRCSSQPETASFPAGLWACDSIIAGLDFQSGDYARRFSLIGVSARLLATELPTPGWMTLYPELKTDVPEGNVWARLTAKNTLAGAVSS